MSHGFELTKGLGDFPLKDLTDSRNEWDIPHHDIFYQPSHSWTPVPADGIFAIEINADAKGLVHVAQVKRGGLGSSRSYLEHTLEERLATNSIASGKTVGNTNFAALYPEAYSVLVQLASNFKLVFGCASDAKQVSPEYVLSCLLLQPVLSQGYALWMGSYFLFPIDKTPDKSFLWQELLSNQPFGVPLEILRTFYETLYKCRMDIEQRGTGNGLRDARIGEAINLAKEVIGGVTPNAKQYKAIQTLVEFSEWNLLNAPARDKISNDTLPAKTPNTKCLPSIPEITEWTPARFFRWFDTAIKETPRKELLKPVKAWLAAQEGWHDCSGLSSEEAVVAKRELAESVNKTLEALGLVLICGKDGCGEIARLRAIQTGTSVSGQYYFSHAGEAPGAVVKHAKSKGFPPLIVHHNSTLK